MPRMFKKRTSRLAPVVRGVRYAQKKRSAVYDYSLWNSLLVMSRISTSENTLTYRDGKQVFCRKHAMALPSCILVVYVPRKRSFGSASNSSSSSSSSTISGHCK